MDEDSTQPICAKVKTCFNYDIIKELIKSKCVNNKNKVTEEAVELVSEVTKVLVVETAVRAAKLASMENQCVISLDHVENVIPQIVSV